MEYSPAEQEVTLRYVYCSCCEQEYKRWILETLQQTWVQFEAKFRGLWSASVAVSLRKSQVASQKEESAQTPSASANGSSPSESEFEAGDTYRISVFQTPEIVSAAQDAYFKSLLADSLGFAGAKIIR